MQVRARTFYAEKTGTSVADVDVPVVGGHAGITILPIFSKATPAHSLDKDTVAALVKRTQEGGTEVVQAKAGKVWSPSTSQTRGQLGCLHATVVSLASATCGVCSVQ